jgi:hypothetical protein
VNTDHVTRYEASHVAVTFHGVRIDGMGVLGIEHDEPGAPTVTLDLVRREVRIGGRAATFTVRERGDGAVILRVARCGTAVVNRGEIESVQPLIEHGSARRRQARRVLYPLARAWAGQPQRAPRGRKRVRA